MSDQYVTIGASGELFGVRVERVQEILDTRPVSRLPHMPTHLLGLIDLRGETIPVVDLSRLLGLEVQADGPHTRIVVTHAGEADILGIRTDRVFEVTALDDDALEPPTSVGGRPVGDCLAGIGRRGGRFVAVVDLDRLVERAGAPVA
jgi:purine-binding chemotaxis protein CheW